MNIFLMKMCAVGRNTLVNVFPACQPVGEGLIMPESLCDKVVNRIAQAADMYYRLVLLVSPSGGGKTAVLQDISKRTGKPVINLNFELCQRMLEMTDRQRVLQLPRLLSGIANDVPADVVLFDNIEVLFDVSLKQDPLKLLQGLSRNKTVVVAWNGFTDSEHVVYATPDHPEYKHYSLRDLLVVVPEAVA